jgi:ribosomal protein S4
MSKHKYRKYDLIRRYKRDVFGIIARQGFRKKWSEETQTFKVYCKNIKAIDRYIKDRLIEKIERKKDFLKKRDKKYMDSFFYRVDVVRLRPKRKRISIYGSMLRRRHFLRRFVADMPNNQLRMYLKKSSKSAKMLNYFLQLFESRLDTVLYRINLLNGVSNRQQISHKNFTVNREICTFPGRQINFLDLVSVVDRRKYFFFLLARIKKTLKQTVNKKSKFFSRILRNPGLFQRYKKTGEIFYNVPSYLEVNYRTLTALFVYCPRYDQVFFPFKTVKFKLPGISKRSCSS